MIEKDISHTFTDSVRKKFIELGFPMATSGQLSKIILPFKVDPIEKKVFSRCDNFFYLEQIIKPYQEEIHDIVKKCWGESFVFEIDNNIEIKVSRNAESSTNDYEKNSQAQSAPVLKATKTESENFDLESQIPKFCFKNFIVGECNKEAVNSCQYILKNSGRFCEPIFIYGQTGIGKTHLLHAIGNEMFKKNSHAKIMYVTIHDFINDVIQKGIRQGKMEEIRRKYKLCDILLVDDIQVLEKKTVCQIEFFHILNTIIQRKKQIIITSNKPPKELKNIDGRLKSRFFQGSIIEIDLPKYSDRVAIIKEKSKILNLNFELDTIEFLASHLKTNIREIEGALNEISFHSNAFKTSINSKECIVNTIQKRVPEISIVHAKKQDLIHLQKTVCHYFDIELSALKGNGRQRNIIVPRHLAIYMAKEVLNFDTYSIVQAFERKHHKIVSYSIKKISELLKTNSEILTHFEILQKKLKS